MKWLRNLLDIMSGRKLAKLRELQAMMDHWHREETIALARAQEAVDCGNMARADMWVARCREARMRYNKDFRDPMIKMTGRADLFGEDAPPPHSSRLHKSNEN